jgi:hypothetical protein
MPIILLLVASPSFAADRTVSRLLAAAVKKDPPKQVESLKKLRKIDVKKVDVKVITILSKLCSAKNDTVRYQAMLTLGDISYRGKLPCPLALAKCVLDTHDPVQYNAEAYVGLFKKFAPGCLEIFLKAMKVTGSPTRSNLATTIARAGRRDPRVLKLLEAGMHDADMLMRHNSHIAMYSINKDLNMIVPYYLFTIERLHKPSKKALRTTKSKQKFVAGRNVLAVGSAYQIRDLGKQQPTKVGKILIPLLNDRHVPTRRAAARTLGAIAGSSKKSKAALVKLNVRDHLLKMKIDKDKSVRRAVAVALTEFK